ncbi:unnamed protein product [Parnassius mnemosyne]|uniref:Integrase catalytic domain-containing protein n=1 Tax=Parnassius mnemosyne TaxID=213953 RepID=A0AAV1LMH1_9NEOP
MPITRSQGRGTMAWTVGLDDGPSDNTDTVRHQMPPRSPSTTEGAEAPACPRDGGVLLPVPAVVKAGTPKQREQIACPCDGGVHLPVPAVVKAGTLKQRKQIEGNDDIRCASPPTARVYSRAEEPPRGHTDKSTRSKKTTRPNKKVLKAREEVLRIKLELAQISLQMAEEDDESDDYDEDGHSKSEYVRSWLENSVAKQKPTQGATTGGEAPLNKNITKPPPEVVDLSEPPMKLTNKDSKVDEERELLPAVSELTYQDPNAENIPKSPVPQKACQDSKVDEDRGLLPAVSEPAYQDPQPEEATKNPIIKRPNQAPVSNEDRVLRPFISELTSAIAALADKPKPESASSNTFAASKAIMTLPSFSGAHTEWLSFRAIYETTRGYFNDIENTARLRRSLQGRALETVSSELIGHAKPDEIMRELELQFGRPDSIAQAETDKLRGLPRCTEAPRDICTFASKVRGSVVTLRALKRDHYLVNAELLRHLTDKLPNSIRAQWYRIYTEKYDSRPDLGSFSEFITEQARYCSAFAPPEIISGAQNNRPVHRTHTATTKPSPKCSVCEKEGHYGSDCNKFKEADIDKRWQLAKQRNLCFRCLRYRSQTHRCKTTKCGIKGCNATHNRLLHNNRKEKTEGPLKEPQETVANSFAVSKHQAYLKIIPVRVIGPAGAINTHALLDDGSTVSLMDQEIADQIGAKGRLDPFKITAIGNTTLDSPDSQRVKVSLKSLHRKRVPFRARTVASLNLGPQTVRATDIENCKHLKGLKDQLTYDSGNPRILIGQDNWRLLIATQVRRGPPHQPIASLTELGWVLHGAHTKAPHQRVHTANELYTSEENINDQLREYFALESLMINPRKPDSDPEKQAEEILNSSTRQLEDGHIETALLWKKKNIEMPGNYETAINRLVSIEKKLDRNEELKQKYNEEMNSLIQKGYAEIAPKNSTPGKTWYLPHFDVHNPMKPEKFRIVHDAAAKTKGMALNDFLLTGPDLLQSLPGVMMRFRRHNVAVSADIAEMFMQIKVRPEDRDALRYLWRGDRRNEAPQQYRMTSIIFGAASSPCTAIFAKNWNAKRYIKKYPEAVEAIIQNHYMDDYPDSFQSLEDAMRISKEVRDIHKNAHFTLRKWVSNAPEIVKELEPDNETTESVKLGDKGTEEKILGLIWKPSTDQLSFNLKLARLPNNLLQKKPTKREALKIVMSLYDPLGLASPVTIRAKQILQEAWRRGTDWDQELDEDLSNHWSTWIQHLERLKTVSIPRCYPGYSDARSLQVHVFSDASESAYATAVYWRATTPDGQVYVSLVMAKAKVAPLKVTSIPRLELQAAVMGSRVAAAVIQEHHVKPEAVTYWTDSKTVLTWIKKGSRSYKPFVAHRIAAIEDNSKVDDWRWVPTKLNIADTATRDVPPNFDSNHEWYSGPSFLYKEPSAWPTERPTSSEPTGEERSLTITERYRAPLYKEAIPDPTKFSKWERLVRATARVLQFITLCRKTTDRTFYKRTKKNREEDPDWRRSKCNPRRLAQPPSQVKSKDVNKYITLEAEYIRKAEKLLVHVIQEDSFTQEIADLRNDKRVAHDSRLRPLQIQLKDGIIALRSRIAAVKGVSEDMKGPAILDGDHHITQLYIDWTHRSLHHCGTEPTINEVRQHYWVIRLRPTTKRIVSQCVQCRIRKAQPSMPATGDHPSTRLAHHQRPFTFTGLDYFGPLSVTVGRQHQKRYVALFTCLTSRAVHLEIVKDLSADSAILALRRFAARRGCPTEIYSDNGTNMHGADKELREAFREEASRRGIVWRFITPSAPFMGGVWERLVRCVKTALYTVLHERHPHEDVLTTLLCEVEYTVNSRPLTHISVDSKDNESITPNHFLLGGSARLPTPGVFSEKDANSKKHWRRSQILADMFWQRWVKEYLPELQNRREAHGQGPDLQVGDPVLIADSQLPRNTWPRGRIENIYPGADGQIRTVEVRTANGLIKRPTRKLVPLPK